MVHSEQKVCQNCKTNFTVDTSDFKFYQKMQLPPPTFCWLCRAQRRMAFRNESSLFIRKSDFSGKEIFSAFAPDAPAKVYEKEIWNGDDWDPMEHGVEVDFSKPFFEQFKKLLHVVPLKNLNLVNNVNSDYCNNFTDPKDCYLTFNGKGAENCMYGNGLSFAKECVDVSHVGKSEWCYESFWLTSCSGVMFSSHCENSYNLVLCKNCTGCNDCFGCVGLRNKSYHIFNKPYAKDEYKKKIREFDLSSYRNGEVVKKKAQEFWLKFPNKFIEGSHNQNVSGNYISHSKNVHNSFLVREGENLRYCQYVQELPGSKDCYDYTAWGDSNELIYECCACGIGTNSIKFCYNVQENVHNIEYSYMCSGSSNLFGCVGLRKKQYCILNKLYSKEEFELLRKKLINHMNKMPYRDSKGRVYKYGEFFPVEISPFAYNETLAQEYFPLTKDEAVRQGFSWRDPQERNTNPTLEAKDLPDRIDEVAKTITSELIGCEHAPSETLTKEGEAKCNHQCTGVFRIIPKELTFYKKMGIPLPRLCPRCRHFSRLTRRTPLDIANRKCQCAGKTSDFEQSEKQGSNRRLGSYNGAYQNTLSHFHKNEHCPNEFKTTYSPNRPEIVYCEPCYQNEFI